MNENFNDLLKSAIAYNISLKVLEHTEDFKNQLDEIDLPKTEYESIRNKMLMLPSKAIFTLFSKHCFLLTPSDIKVFFDIENPVGYLFHYERLISYIAGCNENQILSNTCMTAICKMTLKEYMKQNFNDDETGKVVFLPVLTKHIKKTVKSVTIAACVAIMTFSVTISVNAEFREKVVLWIIETFEKYSIFELRSYDILTVQDLEKYVPQYIPYDFYLQNMIEQPNLILYEYLGTGENNLNIIMSLSDTRIYIDTEGVSLEQIELPKSISYYFEKDNLKHIIFERDGFYFAIYGSISKSELIKIAENIKMK